VSRIISGLAGSLRLAQGAKDTRPTADRVKESVFASLESFDQITGANVLDLFAGTGALGLEALSRGAKSLTLVEKSKSALEVCRKNSESVQGSLAKQGVVVEVSLRHADALVFLKSNAEKYDLVFVDPPYEYSNEKLKSILELIAKCVSSESAVVVERSSRSEEIEITGLEKYAEKEYGDTTVRFFRPISR
jgi:16S rRNA (guanine966-N2)-methyltransferase